MANDDVKELKIRRQIEYYFSDLNLIRDKFMQEELKGDDGWVALETLVKFNRLAALTTDFAKITDAVKDSEVLEVDETSSKVRRRLSNPLPDLNDDFKREVMKRTAYVKNFPLDEKLDDILQFFTEFKVDNVIMRNYKEKKDKSFKFKGSCFVTFPSVEKCQEFIEKETVAYKDVENLIRKFQMTYLEEKKAENAEKKKSKGAKKSTESSNENGTNVTVEGTTGAAANKNNVTKDNELEYPKNSLVKYTLKGEKEDVAKLAAIQLKEQLLQLQHEVMFVEMESESDKNAATNIIRLKNADSVAEFLKSFKKTSDAVTPSESNGEQKAAQAEDAAAETAEKAEAVSVRPSIVVNGVTVEFEAVDSADELAYYKKLKEKSAGRNQKRKKNNHHFNAKRAKRE